MTRVTVDIDGLEDFKAALKKVIKRANVESEEMLAVMLQSISANTMPYVPVDTSTLINSEVRKTYQGQYGPEAYIGYGDPTQAENARGAAVSEYVIYVHDGPQRNWQKPGASNKFLEKGLRDAVNGDFPAIMKRYFPDG